jgi:N-acetylmuramoyl-L-alanine amidase
LRDAAKPPTLQQLRAGIAAYEEIVRRFPRSGYSDNALWQGGNLAILAYERFGQAADQQRAIRLLRSLKKEYPSSSLVPRVDGAIALAQNAKPAPPPAPPPARATPAAPPPVPPAKAPDPPATPDPPAKAPDTAAKAPAAPSADTGRLATLRDISRRSIAGGVRVIIELDREAEYRAERLENPARVFFDFERTEPATWLKDATIRFDDAIVREIRLGRHPQTTTRVVLDMAGAADYSVFALYEPFRLVVDFRAAGAAAAAAAPVVQAAAPVTGTSGPPVAAAATPAPEPAPSVTAPELKTLPTRAAPPLAAPELPVGQRQREVLPRAAARPRHLAHRHRRRPRRARSGDDGQRPARVGAGARRGEAPGGAARKHTDIEVVLTRETDVFIELEERTAIANREGADLFLSIHANSAATSRRAGRDLLPELRDQPRGGGGRGARERDLGTPDAPPAGHRPRHRAQQQDRRVARLRDAIQRAMVQRLSARNQAVIDRGVKQAPFVVLIGAEMPSVLAEISFLTQPAGRGAAEDERLPPADRAGAVRRDSEVPAVGEEGAHAEHDGARAVSEGGP